MTELSTKPAEEAGDVVERKSLDQILDQSVEQQVAQPLPVITTHHVAFSTAAAAGIPRPTLISRFAAVFRRPADDAPRAQRQYPPRRAAFIEDAAMQREMLRL